jgi:hypothetical protein
MEQIVSIVSHVLCAPHGLPCILNTLRVGMNWETLRREPHVLHQNWKFLGYLRPERVRIKDDPSLG